MFRGSSLSMESSTPRSERSSMYASSTDLTDTSIDQIEYYFCASPQFPSMDDILTDAICNNCKPAFEELKNKMVNKINDLKIQFEAFQKIQSDVEEQLWDAWQDNQRYQEEVVVLQRELALKHNTHIRMEILPNELATLPEEKHAVLSNVMSKMLEEITVLDQQQENGKDKEVLNAAVKLLEKRFKKVTARKKGMTGNIVEKCAFLIETEMEVKDRCEIIRGELLDGEEIFPHAHTHGNEPFLFKGDAGGTLEILQFDPNFQFSHVSCSFSHCTKLRHHLTPSKSPNSSVSSLTNNNTKRPLYLCPKHRKQLKVDLQQLLKEASFDHSSFPKSTSRTCEDIIEIISALHAVCERYFVGETTDLKLTEIFLNCRNFLIMVEVLILPCSHSEYNIIHQFLCLLFLQLHEKNTQNLTCLVRDYINTVCIYYGVKFTWTSISPWWGALNPGIFMGGGVGIGILKYGGICGIKAVGLVGFCSLFFSAVWNSFNSRRCLRKLEIGRLERELYGVFIDKNNPRILHNPHVNIQSARRGQLMTP